MKKKKRFSLIARGANKPVSAPSSEHSLTDRVRKRDKGQRRQQVCTVRKFPCPLPIVMALFADSTQREHWILTEEEVEGRRRKAHAAALSARPNLPPGAVLTLAEEALVRQHHERRILRFVAQIKFPDKVAASAVTYFKRFFLDRSVMDFNPSVIALSALYAAFKVEEVLLSADALVSRADIILNGVAADADLESVPDSVDGTAARVPVDALLNGELDFLQHLNFHLICYHPYRSLGVVRERLRESQFFPDPVTSTDNGAAPVVHGGVHLARVIDRATALVVRKTLLSELLLSYPPAIIAMGSFLAAMAEMDDAPQVNDVLDALLESSTGSAAAEVLIVSERIAAMDESESLEPSPENCALVRELEKRRRSVRCDENDPTSKLFQDREREKADALDERRRGKARAQQEKVRLKNAALMGFPEGEGSPAPNDDNNGSSSPDNNGGPRKRLKLTT